MFVEFKAPGKAPRPDQVIEHKRLLEGGVVVHVIDNQADFERLLGEM